MQKRNLRTGRLLWFGCAVILTLIPFHALLTAWFASNFGYFDVIRLWKEIILAVLAVSCITLLLRHPALRRDVRDSRMIQLILAFIGFVAVMALAGVVAGTVAWQAALYGLIIDVRPLAFFLILLVAAHLAPLPYTRRRWILIPALVVVGFGLLQMFILPHDILRHFGYGAQTLPAYQPVDGKPWLARVQSTLRGPNPLGAYLIPIIMSFAAMFMVSKKRRWQALVAIVGSLVVLYGTYSRSAVLGLAVAVWLFGLWTLQQLQYKRGKQVFWAASAALVVIAMVALVGLRHNDTFQNLVFHTNEHSASAQSSNSQRLSGLTSGLRDIIRQPLGGGVGSAGPASLRNTKGHTRIAESYFLQIGQEMGVLGLVLFVAIMAALVKVLYVKRSDTIVRATLATLLGLIVVNMVSHAWADDTLAYVFFALLGYAFIKTSTKSENLATL